MEEKEVVDVTFVKVRKDTYINPSQVTQVSNVFLGSDWRYAVSGWKNGIIKTDPPREEDYTAPVIFMSDKKQYRMAGWDIDNVMLCLALGKDLV